MALHESITLFTTISETHLLQTWRYTCKWTDILVQLLTTIVNWHVLHHMTTWFSSSRVKNM